MRPLLKRLGVNLLLAGLSCAVAVAAFEGLLRVAAHRLLGDGEVIVAGRVIDTHDDPLGFSLIPGSTRVHARGGAYVVRDTINSMGLRDIEHAVEKPEGARRILVLGDSCMYGTGVPMEETMARQLGRMMPGVEVINAGVHAYGLAHEYLYYKHRGHRYRPDLVLVAFFVNDLERSAGFDLEVDSDGLPVAFRRTAGAGSEDRAGPGPRGAISSWLRSRSLLYVLVRKRIDSIRWHLRAESRLEQGGGGVPYAPAFIENPEREIAEDWRRAYGILDELGRLASGHGSRLAIVLVPAPFQISDSDFEGWVQWVNRPDWMLSRSKPQEMILAWCERTGTPCHDLLPVFEGRERKRHFFSHDFHWTPEGHRIAAESVRAFLKEQSLLGPA